MTKVEVLRNRLAGLNLELTVLQRQEHIFKERVKVCERTLRATQKELRQLTKRRREVQAELKNIPKRISQENSKMRKFVKESPGEAFASIAKLTDSE